MDNADIKLGYACNDKCIHCVVEELRNDTTNKLNFRKTQEYFNEVLDSKKKGCRVITVTGGEPTIRKDFLDIIKFIKENGLRVHLQSNGRKFSNSSFTKDVVSYIDNFIIALHGPNSNVHDAVTMSNGSFDETVEGLKNLVTEDAYISGKIVLSKLNYKYVVETLGLYESLGVKYVTVTFPHSSGDPNYISKVAPWYYQIKPYIEQAMDNYSENSSFHLLLEDIMPCALDKAYPLHHFYEFLEKMQKSELKIVGKKVQNWEYLRKAIKKKDTKCKSCIFNGWCDGYWKEYVDERGFDEFKPITRLDNIYLKKPHQQFQRRS